MTAESGPLPTITCPCGFTVSGTDEAENVCAHAQHLPCPNTTPQPLKPPEPPRRWHQSVFSRWGWAVIATIGAAAAVIVEDVLNRAA